MMGWYPSGWGAMGALGMTAMVITWVIVVAAAVWIIARATRTDHAAGPLPEAARSILDRRFAAGDIGAEEYARARRALASPDAPAGESSEK